MGSSCVQRSGTKGIALTSDVALLAASSATAAGTRLTQNVGITTRSPPFMADW
jgi:hypothetical protein